MAQTIRVKRGTKSELSNYGKLAQGELGFCTDTGEVFIGNDTQNLMVGRALSGTLEDRPNALTSGRFFYVTEGENKGYIYFDDSVSWNRINVTMLSELIGSLDDIKDGVAFKRILAEDIKEGHVTTISDGTNSISAVQIKNHLEKGQHYSINDTGYGNDELWSSQKIKAEIYNAISGLEWQDSVISRITTAPPESPNPNDRYIIPDEGEGEWEGKLGQIAVFNGSGWDYSIPYIGTAVFVEDENKNYTYNSSSNWVTTGGANQSIVAGNGLVGGGNSDTITLEIGQGDGITVQDDSISVKSHSGIVVNSDGVSVNIDKDSLSFDEEKGCIKVANIDGGTFS